MTREEARKHMMLWVYSLDDMPPKQVVEALTLAADDLRPVSREQVEKAWRGDWKFEPDIYDCGTYVCSKCGEPWTLIDGTPVENNMNFCPNCGAALTDEAVEMVMERLEALRGETETD